MASHQWTKEPTRPVKDDEYPISASAVKRLRRCPKQFEYRYLTDKPTTEEAGKYADVGTAVHETLEKLLNDESLDSLVDRPHSLRQMLTSDYRSRVPDYDEETVERGVAACHTAARFLAMDKSPDLTQNSLRGTEVEFEFGLKRPDIDSGFQGKIDVATQREIWDWKTGTTIDEDNERIQGMMYVMGFYQKYGVVPERVRFVYLHEDVEKERLVFPTDENWQDLLSKIRNVVTAKESGEFPAKPESSKCHWCGWSGWCDAFPAGAGDIKYELF